LKFTKSEWQQDSDISRNARTCTPDPSPKESLMLILGRKIKDRGPCLKTRSENQKEKEFSDKSQSCLHPGLKT
jgi:hypothetical protein